MITMHGKWADRTITKWFGKNKELELNWILILIPDKTSLVSHLEILRMRKTYQALVIYVYTYYLLRVTSSCCWRLHIQGQALGLEGGLHNYLGVSLSEPGLTSGTVASEGITKVSYQVYFDV